MTISLKNNYFKLLLSFLLILIFNIRTAFKWNLDTALFFGVVQLIAAIALAIVFWVLLAIIVPNKKSGFANRILISSILLVVVSYFAGFPVSSYSPGKSSRNSVTLCDCLKNSKYASDSRCKTKFRAKYGTSDPSMDQMSSDYYSCP